jgi:putative hydrolase of the HAD superfamily
MGPGPASRTGSRPASPAVRALLIDAHGTLVRLLPPVPRLRALLSERLGVRVTAREAECAIRAEIAHYRSELHTGRDPASVLALRRGCAEVLRSALPPDPRLRGAQLTTVTELLLGALRFEAFPDAGPALAQARRGGVRRIVVVSNWDASLPETLERTGLLEALDGVVASAAIGAAKPDPAIFDAALELAEAAPSQALHVGDSLAEDVEGARRAGIRPLWLVRDRVADRRCPPDPRPIPSIGSLSELQAHLADPLR